MSDSPPSQHHSRLAIVSLEHTIQIEVCNTFLDVDFKCIIVTHLCVATQQQAQLFARRNVLDALFSPILSIRGISYLCFVR